MEGKKREVSQNISEGQKNLTQIAYGKIKEMMLNYDIVPGQRLIFDDFAKRLGMSRTPVNSALTILANEGFLDFVPNQGYRVHEISQEEATYLYQIREILELGIITQAIKKFTPDKLKLLENQKALYEKAVVEHISRGRFILDQEFHACCIELAENPYLTNSFRDIYQRIFLRHRIEGLRADRARQVVTEHDEIFNSIRIQDVKRTKQLIKRHIRAGRDYIFSCIFGSVSPGQ
jgi:DNA-binding GntR family transcriptional regulator